MIPWAIAVVEEEIRYQEQKWGNPGMTKTTEEYLTYIRSYLRSAEDFITKGQTIDALDQVRKIAALAIVAMGANGVISR